MAMWMWTRQAVGQQHNNNTPATYVLEVRRAVAQLLLVNRATKQNCHTTVTGISSRNLNFLTSSARFSVGGARSALGRCHVKNRHVRDAVKNVAQDVARNVAEGESGAAEDGSLKVLILSIVLFQRRNPCPTHASTPPTRSLR